MHTCDKRCAKQKFENLCSNRSLIIIRGHHDRSNYLKRLYIMTRLIGLQVKTVDTYLTVFFFFFGKVIRITRVPHNNYIHRVYFVIKNICLQYKIQRAWPCVGNNFFNSSKNSYLYAHDELLPLYIIIIRSTWPFHNTTQLQPAVNKIRVATIYVIETT